MLKLVWTERLPDGSKAIKTKTFKDAEMRFRFVLGLEKNPHFIKVLEWG